MKKTNIISAIMILSTLFYACNKIDPVEVSTDPNNNNKYPVANAGTDQEITLPTNSVELDGSASSDPDGFINLYRWSKIAGPNAGLIVSPDAPRTTIKNLVSGIYQFLLAVRDNGGLIASDTIQVTVNPAVGTCNVQDRPHVNATLTEIGRLSVPRAPMVVTAGNKIVFAGTMLDVGGYNPTAMAAVDIYDMYTHSWQTYQLSVPRCGMAVVSCGNKIFFAGGNYGDNWYDIVDIYDISNNSWTVAHLSEAKSFFAAASVGNKVFFAGGINEEGWNQTANVNIYDLSDNSWSSAYLSQPKFALSAVTAGNKIYFAGGINYMMDDSPPFFKSIDIYDASTNSWSVTNFNDISGGVSGFAVDDIVYWGGVEREKTDGRAEILNSINVAVTLGCLSYPREYPTAFARNNEVVFFTPGSIMDNTSSNQFDIYDRITGKWAVGLLDHPAIAASGIISVNNIVYMGGGKTSIGYTDKVYILNW